MKNTIILVSILLLVGCSYSQPDSWHSSYYVPDRWLRDPKFSDYKQKREEIEIGYLERKFRYEEYMDKMQELNKLYEEGVRNREDDHYYSERWIY
ncbi:MAG: hypothetical protein H6756_02525 [Candidatus Omnitrophica bacterium]|nr:hypothetical protein [Candidatus Omnitrophota bacterium]